MAPSAVTVSLEDLKQGDVSFSALESAFGPESLGIILVKDVPAKFTSLRHFLLSYLSYLGNLPAAELETIENVAAKYMTGWSRGKETLKTGQGDTLKGSFYANCAFYVDPSLDCAVATKDFSPHNFPEYLSPNIWPREELLPGFKQTFEALCRIIIDTAILVAQACDRYAEATIPHCKSGYLEHVVKTSTTTKARLLHYFPHGLQDEPVSDLDDDDWCATHIDHSCLTGLTSAMFIDEEESRQTIASRTLSKHSVLLPLEELSVSPDPAAGLYVRSRGGDIVHVKIPRDCIAFQTGEALERITRGKFRAVSHFVKGVRSGSGKDPRARIARNTLAVFMQPNLDDIVDFEQGISFGEFSSGIVNKNTKA